MTSASENGSNWELLKTELASELCGLLDQAMIKVQHCFGQLSDEQIWWRPQPEMNSIGNLALHMAGNLRQWAVCGLTDAIDSRQREQEFSQIQIIPAAELLELMSQTVRDAQQAINGFPADDWASQLSIQGFTVSAFSAASHTCTHFVGHTHQIIQLTRIQLGGTYQFQWTPDLERGTLPI